MPFASNASSRMYYEIYGEKTPLILLSGMGRDHSTWYPLIEQMQSRFQVILIDNLGVGQSQFFHEWFTMRDMAEGVKSVVDDLGHEKVHFLGHSMGGFVAQHFALLYPKALNKLALFSTTACQGIIPRVSMDSIYALRNRKIPLDEILATFIPLAFSPRFLNQEGVYSEVLKGMMDAETVQSPRDFKRQIHASKEHDTRQHIDKIHHETLICTGSCDLLATVEEARFLKTHIPQSSLKIIEGVGHIVQVEAPEKFLQLVMAFFSA